jgi:hypothetical protein
VIEKCKAVRKEQLRAREGRSERERERGREVNSKQ